MDAGQKQESVKAGGDNGKKEAGLKSGFVDNGGSHGLKKFLHFIVEQLQRYLQFFCGLC